MRVAALYDVHGNLTALEAVLGDVAEERVDAIVAGGDVLWGPHQGECIALLRAAGASFLSGNCERDVLAGRGGSATWCRDRLTPEERELVATWPASVELTVDDLGRVLFCHASPRSDEENLTELTTDEELADALADAVADVVVVGHTHVQLDRTTPVSRRLVNAGSVGVPCQGEPGAFWAILGPNVELRRTSYDVERALAGLAASGFPRAAAFEDAIRGRVRAESATAYFESKQHAA
jgi:predicted phosphodiesterase